MSLHFGKGNSKALAGSQQGKTDSEASAARVPSPETLEILRNIRTEIGAGMVLKLGPLSQLEQVHNNACERAKSIIENYMNGYGLFQMTRGMK